MVIPIGDIPYTDNGKKVELAVKNTILKLKVKNTDYLENPESLEFYKGIRELELWMIKAAASN